MFVDSGKGREGRMDFLTGDHGIFLKPSPLPELQGLKGHSLLPPKYRKSKVKFRGVGWYYSDPVFI